MLKPCFSFCLLYSEICSYSYVLDNDFERIPHGFSSPIFGDMFLLQNGTFFDWGDEDEFSSPIFGGMFLLNYLIILSLIMKRFRLLYSEICSYSQARVTRFTSIEHCFCLLYSEICSY